MHATQKSYKDKTNNGVNLGIENELWEAADKLRGHLDAGEIFALHSVGIAAKGLFRR